MRDYFGVFGDHGGEGAHETPRNKRQLSPQEAALVVFEIEPPFTMVRLKARYKELVKLHHPDAHGGDKAAEEKLKVINQAYSTLKASYFS
jgi:DnaJ-domain-containing protein 1